MNNKKQTLLPNEIPLEQLLEEINKENLPSSEKEPDVSFLPEGSVLHFLSYYNINPGENKVKVSVLYKIYTQWSKSKKMNAATFSRYLYNFFKNENKYIFINVNAINLTKAAKDVYFNNPNILNRDKLKSKAYKNQMDKFISAFGLSKGKYMIPAMSLYYVYQNWIYETNKKAINKLAFIGFLKLYFKHDMHEKQTIIFIDKDCLKIDGETLEKAKAWTQVKPI